METVVLPSKRKPYLHSFANEWLYRNGYEVWQGNNQILAYKKGNKFMFDIRTGPSGRIVDTCLIVGVDLYDTKTIREITKYQTLVDLGFMVISIAFSSWFSNQKRAYKIIPRQSGVNEIGKIPDGHRIFWDVYNKLLYLIGQNAGPAPSYQAPPVKIEPGKRVIERRKTRMIDHFKNPYSMDKEYLKDLIPHSPEEYKRIPIDEMAVLISDEGELVCLPKSRDEPTIGIMGQKGKGKSWLLHRLADLAYWKARRKVGILNDERGECSTWCSGWDADPSHKTIGLSMARRLALINERPLPLPIVPVHAMNNNLKFMVHEQECGIKMSFPFADLITNYESYMKGKEDWELKNSLPYFKNIKDMIVMCKDLDEIQEVIETNIDKQLNLTKIKLQQLMEDIFNENMLDITNKIPAQLTLKTKDEHDFTKTISQVDYNPFVALMLADVVPVFETMSLKRKGYWPQYFKFVVDDIFRKQSEDPYFINNKIRIWLFCDEIQSIDSRRKQTAASETLIKVVTEGRPNRTGFIWASQNPEILSEQITTNTPYFFVLGFSKLEQANEITKNFNLMKGREQDILNLRKLEAIACTSEHFVVYDRNGKRSLSKPGKSFKGNLLPPLSWHKPPSEEEA